MKSLILIFTWATALPTEPPRLEILADAPPRCALMAQHMESELRHVAQEARVFCLDGRPGAAEAQLLRLLFEPQAPRATHGDD